MSHGRVHGLGETIVRDLQLGLRRAVELGGAMPVGYLPDMFGHIAQMPQILRLAGFEHAVVWRGVPSTVTQTAFAWEAPDGSAVRASTSTARTRMVATFPTTPSSWSRGRELRARARPGRLPRVDAADERNDHQMPQPWLGRVVAERMRSRATTGSSSRRSPSTSPSNPPTVFHGAGRAPIGRRANVLMGVASNASMCTGVRGRRACARAAGGAAVGAARAGGQVSDALLGIAWQKLVENSAHDSSCACSDDEVVDQVMVRYREARQIGDVLAREAMRQLATEVDIPACRPWS